MVGGEAVRIVICDDSATYAEALTRFLQHDPAVRVVGVFPTAEEMLPQLERLDPDLVTMDLEMPGMGGLEAITDIMRDRPLPILVLSAEAGKGSEKAAEALAAGALEAMAKSSLQLLEPADVWATATRSRFKRLASVQLKRRTRTGRVGPAPPQRRDVTWPFRVLGIGASTGGPPALLSVLGALPSSFRLPVIVVQHITPGFTEGLVTWLNRSLKLPVAFAEPGAIARPGIWVAPDDGHVCLEPSMRFLIDRKTRSGAHRPSVDMLLQSLAASVGAEAMGVILTGMGRDGAEGVEALRAAGGSVIAQDQETSAVFGMPRAAI
ncbi:MAG: response regulator, partial [Actinomycetota bacterium]|nr:response regulator [Actinomycetota bacterium]